MSKHYMLPILSLMLGGVFLSLTPGYNDRNDNQNRSYYTPPQNSQSGIAETYYPPQQSKTASGQEQIAYEDERDIDIHERANRKGDWGYRQNWRYDREAFYKGKTQGEAYDMEHQEGAGGPGMDPDTDYLQMRKYYLENAAKNPQNTSTNQRSQYSYPSNYQSSGYR